ncbi:HNH endonuclease [Paludibaculum fermentans]|uniref:HNH endonuclease n=1 Tax=Paludibaculum fermentans TaxID=1473598 RepID=UPI003EBCEDC6
MRYWWVNQNQTYRHELAGGYLWSPKRNRDGGRNPFYESMREVAPGDIIFSFKDTRIVAIGVAQSHCWESPKPAEFGVAGQYWENVGWKVRVQFTPLLHQLRPKDHIDVLRSELPGKYAPLQSNGNGLQGIYLTEVSEPLAEVLGGLIGPEARLITMPRVSTIPAHPESAAARAADDLDYWEHKLEQLVVADTSVPETEKEAIIRARRGQGLFKQRVLRLETQCRITGVDKVDHLVASHCKPWRDSSNEERLNGENGLLLTPTIDHLFDRGFIGFEDSGDLIVSPVAHRQSLQRMGVETGHVVNVGGFTQGQRRFLDFHRTSVLLRAVR